MLSKGFCGELAVAFTAVYFWKELGVNSHDMGFNDVFVKF